MSELFNKVKNQLKSKLPFAVYCKPNASKTIAFLQNNDTLFDLNTNNQAGFAFVSFDNLQRFLLPEDQCDLYFEKNDALDYFVPTAVVKTPVDKQAQLNFEKLVQNAIESIKNNAFEKVVLSRYTTIDIAIIDLQMIFNKLLFEYPMAFKSMFYHPKIGLWIGATPEQFVKIDGDKLTTVSLAGTQVYDKNTAAIWQDKERNEQQIVTNYINNELLTIAKKVTVSVPYTHRAGNLVHLKTDVQATLNTETTITVIANLLHPTPAVCGFPKENAKQFIEANELYDREFYSGFIGEWKKDFESYKEGNCDLYVNLRCMKIIKNKAQLYVGCGITKDSDAKKEFFETDNKMKTMLAVLQRK